MKSIGSLSLSLAVLAVAATAQAGVIGPTQTLASLLPSAGNADPSILVGDKLFHGFAYSNTGDMPNALGVNVIPIIDAYGNLGIRFQGGFKDSPGNGPSDALINYIVTVEDPTQAISGALIQANPVVVGSASMNVTETWVPDAGSTQIGVFDMKPGATQLADAVSFLPKTFTSLHVQKDILGDAGAATVGGVPSNSLAFMSFVDQTFSQVPEPASLSLLAVGGLALLLRRQRA